MDPSDTLVWACGLGCCLPSLLLWAVNPGSGVVSIRRLVQVGGPRPTRHLDRSLTKHAPP